MRVVVSGWIVPFPTATFFWHAMGFAVGFADLGHDVWYVEDSSDDYVGFLPSAGGSSHDPSDGIEFLRDAAEAIGFGDRWAFRHVPAGRTFGMTETDVLDVLNEADLLVDVAVTLEMRDEYRHIPCRLAIDTDPVFNQIRLARGDHRVGDPPATHTRLFTFGRPPLPAQANEWVPTRQPVASRFWPVLLPPPPDAPLTTIARWKAYDEVTWDGVVYGGKERSFREIAGYQEQSPVQLAAALGGELDPTEGTHVLTSHGWSLLDAAAANASSEELAAFIGSSLGEIGVAKHGYIVSRCGWFSERSCCYLACGRPVVASDTGWSDWLPSSKGLLAFKDRGTFMAAVEALLDDPAGHSRAARALVEREFEAADVCRSLLDAL